VALLKAQGAKLFGESRPEEALKVYLDAATALDQLPANP
jgi:hypothetical protein